MRGRTARYPKRTGITDDMGQRLYETLARGNGPTLLHGGGELHGKVELHREGKLHEEG